MSDIEFKEKCKWYYNIVSPETKYVIHNQKTIIQNAPYSAKCAQKLCDISYDNNKITINIGGNKTVCIPINIRKDCPKIKVVVPNDSFSVTDSINSECSNDSVESNSAIINDTHPNWEIITETRTCVLGYLPDNNPNLNGPIGGIGGCVSACGGCVGCFDGNICQPSCPTECGYGNCGQSGDDSRPWNVYINGIKVYYPLATSNSASNELINSEWELNMRQIYNNIATCKTKIPDNISQPYHNATRSYSISDIVEGVVPESCSELKFDKLNYNATKYRGSKAGPQEVTTMVTIRVAYYTYSYRRPKNIQDFLKTEEISKKCNERATMCNPNLIRITSNYNTESCSNTPTCYDTNTERCRNDQYCCKANKIEFQ